jgi:predicted transposase/invertase (TIGR01784 family)
VTTRHPRNLLAFLKKRFTVRQEQQGIYLVDGEVYPTQIIVVTELSDKENLWLASLRNDLTLKQLTQAFEASIGKPNIGPFIVAIANGNKKALEELYMQRTILTEKLDVYFTEKYAAPWIAEGKAKGNAEGRSMEKVEIARNMKNKGYDPTAIAEVTGLPSAEIRRLR